MPELTIKKKRPLWYNLSPVNLPVPGMVSIFHRISGAALFIGLFWLLYLLELSLSSPSAFEKLRSVIAHPFGKLVLIGFAWAYLHHFCAGIRYLVLDLHIGDELATARKSAVSVFIVSLLLTLAVAVAIW
jgi:succinate dehydrogenase / fumarate reductase cytochrome b subunit